MSVKKKIGILILIALPILLYVGGRIIIPHLIEKQIDKQIAMLKTAGFTVQYDSLSYSLKPCQLRIKNLQIESPADSLCAKQSTIHIALLHLDGISILPIIFKQKLEIQSIVMEAPVIHYFRDSKKQKTDTGHPSKLDEVFIQNIKLNNLILQVYDSSRCEPVQEIKLSLDVSHLALQALNADTVRWAIGNTLLTAVSLKIPEKFYTITAQFLEYNATNHVFAADTLNVIPDYNKPEFVQKSKLQTDRISGVVSHLEVRGIRITDQIVKQLEARAVDVQFDLDIFRDKRYPFNENHQSRLPVDFIHNLPLKLNIDTLHVRDSKIVYEEFPENGEQHDKAGRIFFERLESTVYHISNFKKQHTTMHARARFMNAGDLEADFTFPDDPEGAYTANGNIINLNLPAINTMLEPMANARIATGLMKEMHFNFVYNNYRSDGSLMMEYKDLKIETTRKNKNDKKVINVVTTFLVNLFVRKDMDKNISTDKKTGIILFYRDNKKSLFNYWWKSILSGIKSVYNLDKITDTAGKTKKR